MSFSSEIREAVRIFNTEMERAISIHEKAIQDALNHYNTQEDQNSAIEKAKNDYELTVIGKTLNLSNEIVLIRKKYGVTAVY